MSTAYKLVPLVSLRIVRDRTVRYPVPQVEHGGHAAALARALIGEAPTESMLVICLDVRVKVLSVSFASMGGTCATAVSPADVFRPAIVAGARAVVLAHNHPSGDPTPSAEDIATTRKMVEMGEVLGVDVVDHVIVTDTDERSMFAMGIL
jgi:DNA repair protein RadC